VVTLAVVVTMMVGVLQEKVFICAVGSESDSSDAEAREQALEAVEAAEGAVIPPCLTGNLLASDHTTHRRNKSYLRAQGSRLAKAEDGEAAALNWAMSKPVGFRAGIVDRLPVPGGMK
jgi:hypothetical protein